jgi:hypothetical protein
MAPATYGNDLTNNVLTITQAAAGNDALTLSLASGTYTLTDTGGLFFGTTTGNDAADVTGGGTSTITVPQRGCDLDCGDAGQRNE